MNVGAEPLREPSRRHPPRSPDGRSAGAGLGKESPGDLLWRQAFENAPVALALTDGEGVVAANRACTALWKAASPDLLQRFSLAELLRPQLEDALRRVCGAPPDAQGRYPLTTGRIVRLDGETRDVEIAVSRLGLPDVPAAPPAGRNASGSRAAPPRSRPPVALIQLAFTDVTEQLKERRQLENSRRELRHLSANLVSAREEERKHLARELHDDLGQQLTALKIGLADLSPTQTSGRDARLAGLLGRLDESFASLRRITTNLRPPVLDDLGLNAAIEWLARESAARFNLSITVQLGEPQPPSTDSAAIAVYRTVQEALTNVARHAHASQVSIETRCAGGIYRLIVRDNGVGFTAKSLGRAGSHGLMGLRERACMIGGHLYVGNAPGGGGCLTLELPLHDEPAAPHEGAGAGDPVMLHPGAGPGAAAGSDPGGDAAAAPLRSAEALMHELHVHQIELEMQNEELRRAQIELGAARDRFLNLYDYAPVGYLTLDRDGLVIEANLTGTRMLGEKRNGLVKRRLARFIAPHDGDRWHLHLRRALQENGPLRIELEMQDLHGDSFQAQVDSLRVAPVGTEATLRLTITDISERKQAEMDRRIATTAVEAREAERRRVSRALHEELGQELSALKMDLASLPAAAPGVEREERMGEILSVLDTAVATVRRIATDLRPLLLDDLGLGAAIDWLARDTALRQGVQVRLDLQEREPPLNETATVAVFRMGQEALLQMARGAAGRQLLVSMRHTPGELTLSVQDEGPDQEAPPSGPPFDLTALRQQVHLLRGRLEVENRIAAGRRIAIRLPMLRATDQAADPAPPAPHPEESP